MVELSPEAVTTLEHLARTDPDPRVRWRAQSLVVLARSRTLWDAARLTSVDRTTLCRWRKRYLADGRDGLGDHPKVGRPAKLPAEARTLVATVLEELPTMSGYATATWTLADLQDLLARKGWVVALTTVSRTLHQLGYSYRHDLRHRQDADSVATAQQTLRILQQKGGLTGQESAWYTAMSATCTPIRTWRNAGSNEPAVPASLPPGSTSAAPSMAPLTTAPETSAGTMTSAPAQSDS